jgi:hypothetical protein
MRSLELDEEKITQCRNKLLESYFGGSVVERAVGTIDYSETVHANLDFLYLGRWIYIPRNWFTDPSIYPDLVFSDIGRGIAMGEEKYIVDKILANDNVSKITLDTIGYDNIVDAVNSLVLEMPRPLSTLQLTLFSPIKYFVTMHIDWAREHGMTIRPNELIIDGYRIRPFWSSKYIDYDEFIVSERSLCRWIAKPTVENRLEVEIIESDKMGEMELKAQTVLNFAILDPEKIRVLRSAQHPET